MENKYTADDLLKALKHSLYEMPYEQYTEFKASLMGVDKNDLDALSEKGIFTLAYELGAEKFLDTYNKCLKNFKNTLHVGDVYRNTRRASICYKHKVIITEYDKSNDSYYALYDDGAYIKTTNESFDFDCYEKIGSIDTKTFVHSKNDLINKANEL
jgi:hypothetical protein